MKQICWVIRYLRIIYSKCIARKCLTLKLKVKVKEHINRNGPSRLQISTSLKVILEHFSLALAVFQIFAFQTNFATLKMLFNVMMNNFAVLPYDGKYLTSNLMAIVLFAIVQPKLVKIEN